MADTIELTWYGHSCFGIKCGNFTVITDPYSPGSVPGLKDLKLKADAVYCSHEHGDHNGRDCVTLSGKAAPAAFHVEQLQCPHDDKNGTLRGMNLIRKFTFGDFTAVHMGDIGCEITDEILAFIKGCDLLLIPVGGFFTIDGAQAAEIVKAADPKITVPMHYRGESFGYRDISTVKPFTDLCPVTAEPGSTLTINDATASGVYVMTPLQA